MTKGKTDYSKKGKAITEEVVEAITEEVVEEITEEVVEETSEETAEETAEEVVEETAKETPAKTPEQLAAEELEEAGKPYVTGCKGLTLRRGPGLTSNIITVLLENETVELIKGDAVECEAGHIWVSVKSLAGRIGYVSSKYLGNYTK
jgi:uncharacterized protein YgiM (DUF1202 family)